MANTYSDVKRELVDGNYEGLKKLDNWGPDFINGKSDITNLTLLHKIIKSKKKNIGCCCSGSSQNDNLCTAENIKFLIEEGARLDLKEINGDTPLHTAVSVGVDTTILDVLINTKHKDCEQCRCGQVALQTKNNLNKTPIEIDYISDSCFQKLNLEGESG